MSELIGPGSNSGFSRIEEAILWAEMDLRINQAMALAAKGGQRFNWTEGLSPAKRLAFFDLVKANEFRKGRDELRERLMDEEGIQPEVDPEDKEFDQFVTDTTSRFGLTRSDFKRALLEVMPKEEVDQYQAESTRSHPIFGQASLISRAAFEVAKLYVIQDRLEKDSARDAKG